MTVSDELSIPEIAKLAGVTESAVRQWMDADKITVSSIRMHGGQRRRFATRASVEAFLRTPRSGKSEAEEATSRPPNTAEAATC